MVGQIATWTVVKDHVQVLGRLERIMHLQHKWMRRTLQYIRLAYRILQVIILDQEVLVKYFHGHCVLDRFRIVFEIDFEHFAKGALA